MRRKIHQYVRSCHKYQIMNLQKTTLYWLTSRYCTNSYTWTAGYFMTTPLKDKKMMTVANHLFSDIMLKFGFPRILHSHNDMEFKSKLIENLSQQLGMKKTYFSPCCLQAGGKLEFSHRFIMDCIWTFSVDGVLEWVQLLPYATATFSWFPNEQS